MKTAEFVKKILAKAGVTHEGEIGEDLPDDVATSADNALLTIAAATNNHPAVKKVYFAQAFNGLDADLAGIRGEVGINDEAWTEILKAGSHETLPGGSTNKRVMALVRKIKDLSDKAKPEDKTKADALAAQVTDLNGKLAAEITKQTTLKTDFDTQLKKIKIQTKLSGLLAAYKTVYDDLPVEAKDAAVSALLTKELQDSDADFTFDEKGNLSLIKKDGTNLFGENHTLVTPQSFIDKSLSKILKVTGPAAPQTPAPALPGVKQNEPNTALSAALAESRSNYETASKNAVAV